jgi:hypothetical protein
MKKRSVWAVIAGVLFIIVITTLVDIALHAAGVYPPLGQPINDALAVLAIPQCWVGGKIYEMRSGAGPTA